MEALSKLPTQIRRLLLEKTGALAECEDPKRRHKALDSPLRGYFSIRVSRYRAIYTVKEEELANGDVLVHVQVVVVAVGMRKEGDRRDVYHLARKLIRQAGFELEDDELEDGAS